MYGSTPCISASCGERKSKYTGWISIPSGVILEVRRDSRVCGDLDLLSSVLASPCHFSTLVSSDDADAVDLYLLKYLDCLEREYRNNLLLCMIEQFWLKLKKFMIEKNNDQ